MRPKARWPPDRPAVAPETITSVLLLSAGVAISPLPVLAVIALLVSRRPRPTSLAFAAGWLGGIVAVLTVALGFAIGASRLGLTGLQRSAAVIGIVLGVLVMVAGVLVWVRRPADDAGPPGWLAALDELPPSRAFAAGGALSAVNPKNLVASGTAGLMLGWSGLPPDQITVIAIAFCLLAGSTVLVPVLVFLAVGRRAQDQLFRLRDWLLPRQAGLVAALLVAIGLLLVVRGISGA